MRCLNPNFEKYCKGFSRVYKEYFRIAPTMGTLVSSGWLEIKDKNCKSFEEMGEFQARLLIAEKEQKEIKEDIKANNTPFDADEIFYKKMECYPNIRTKKDEIKAGKNYSFKKRKVKTIKVGVSSLSKAADRIKVLDKVLTLFKMRIGADVMSIDVTNGKITGIKLTVYFIE